jgi:hypothetical protein
MHLTSSQDYRKIDSLIKRGPRVIMLVYSTTCPHCVTYLPIWKKLCKEKGKTAHMVSMEHSVYSDTPMAAKKPVSGVPTVLFVDPKGEIHEEDNIRDESVMKKAMTESSPMMSEEESDLEEEEKDESEEVEEEIEEPMLRTSEVSDGLSNGLSDGLSNGLSNGVTEASVFRPAKNRTATPYPDSIRGTTEVEDKLPALPATPIRTLTMTGGSYTGSQRGGDPFSAFVAVARQAAPAAALLAAYGLLPKNKRSSGLGAARRSRNRKTKRAKRT